MKNNNCYPAKRSILQATFCSGLFSVVLTASLLMPQASHAFKGVPMPACAEKLFSCAVDAAQTIGQSYLTVGNLLGHIVANAECVAAISNGSPPAIGVTGLIVGLGAAGVVNPNSCEASVYGPAIIPVGAALDAVLGSSLASQLEGATLKIAMDLIKPIPVPALPPTVGGLIGCGCGALEAGAKALDDVRKVAKFAAQTYESCGAAANSCPGLKQAVAVLKGAYQVITDPSSIVQNCDSMSRQQYVDARLRDLIIPVRDQFRNNVAWSGSNMEINHWNPRLATCNKYYDSHCYKEDDAKAFCSTAVWTETFDPLVWAAIIEEFNGPQFDKYFAENRQKLSPPAACPKNPASAINLDLNQVAGPEQAKAAQSANARACADEMTALVNGDTGSMKSLAREMLPTTREGWDADVRQKYNEKPLDNAKKVFLRVMTAAAVVTKYKMASVSAKYAEQDANLATNTEFAAVPYIVLNQKYGQWANIIAQTIQDSCPKDPNGWNGKYDLTCVKELAISVGMNANEAETLKLDGQIVGAIAQSISKGSFKGSKYYNIASDIILNGKPGSVLPIRIMPWTAEKATAKYTSRWSDAEAAASLAYAADMPGFFGRQFERVAQDKAKRKAQDDIFAAFEKDNKIESEYAGTVCDKLKNQQSDNPMPGLCRADIDRIATAEASRFAVSKAGAFLNLNNPAKPSPDAAMAKSMADIKAVHDRALVSFYNIHTQYKVDFRRGTVAPKVDLVGNSVLKGQTVSASPGQTSGTSSGTQGNIPNLKDQKAPLGALGMPGLPQMGRTQPSANRVQEKGINIGTANVSGIGTLADIESGASNTGKTGGNPVAVNTPPAPGAGAVAALKEELLKPGGPTIRTPPFTFPGTPAPGAGPVAALKDEFLKPGGPPIGTGTLPPASPALPSVAANSPFSTPGVTPLRKVDITVATSNSASRLPFDPVLYRTVREKAIGDEWFGKCSNKANCLQIMSGVSSKLINAEIMQLKTGTPDHSDKAAVLAFQNSLDGLFDPQFKAAIPAQINPDPAILQKIPPNFKKLPL